MDYAPTSYLMRILIKQYNDKGTTRYTYCVSCLLVQVPPKILRLACGGLGRSLPPRAPGLSPWAREKLTVVNSGRPLSSRKLTVVNSGRPLSSRKIDSGQFWTSPERQNAPKPIFQNKTSIFQKCKDFHNKTFIFEGWEGSL